jgi:hypothetical protein
MLPGHVFALMLLQYNCIDAVSTNSLSHNSTQPDLVGILEAVLATPGSSGICAACALR